MTPRNHDGSPDQDRNAAAAAAEPAGGSHKGFEDVFAGDFAEMQALMAALPGMLGGQGSGPVSGPAGTTLATLGARLGLLEESFGRICNVVGRLEQEMAALKERADGHGR